MFTLDANWQCHALFSYAFLCPAIKNNNNNNKNYIKSGEHFSGIYCKYVAYYISNKNRQIISNVSTDAAINLKSLLHTHDVDFKTWIQLDIFIISNLEQPYKSLDNYTSQRVCFFWKVWSLLSNRRVQITVTISKSFSVMVKCHIWIRTQKYTIFVWIEAPSWIEAPLDFG